MNGWIVFIIAVFAWAVIDRICECIEKRNKKKNKED